MLERILKLYTMAMAGDVRSPTPHLFGPPGCGKSSTVQQAADIIGVKMHTINVSRISPLELEGVQMPVTHEVSGMKLELLHATFWTQLNEGDIVLFDEFLRGFPEMYNGLLDIFTSREVGGLKLPKVFIIAASNSTVAYDKALEDRLLHIPVADPRKGKNGKTPLAKLLVDALGLMPEMKDTAEMASLLDTEVLPMFDVLDSLGKGSSAAVVKGRSIRNLIGQAQLRDVQCTALVELIDINNQRAIADDKYQFVFLLNGKAPHWDYMKKTSRIPKARLTPVQRLNMELNHQLIALEEERSNKKGDEDDASLADDESPF